MTGVRVFEKDSAWYWQPNDEDYSSVGGFKTEAAAQRAADTWLKKQKSQKN